MSEVGAAVGDLLILTSQRATGLCPVCAPFLAARNTPLGAFDLCFGFSEKSRVFDNAAVGISGEPVKAHIYVDRRFRFDRGPGQVGQVELDQRDMSFARRPAFKCRAF
jgi:hypothetical protein